jgi:hypothetical protein
VSEGRKTNWALLALFCAGGSAVQIYDLSTAIEYPSQTLAILQYLLLAGSLLGLVASLIQMASGKR